MNRILKKLLRITLIVSVLIGLIFFAFSKLEKSRLEKTEREKKIMTGTCVFDKTDLDNFSIKHWDKSFTPILDKEVFKKYFNEDLSGVSLNDSSTKRMTIRVDNNDFTFYSTGKNIFIRSIDVDKAGEFSFKTKDNPEFSAESKVDDFKDLYPDSYGCRENQVVSWRQELFAMRIDNSNIGSKLRFIILYFNRADNLSCIEFCYDGMPDANE